MNSLNQTTPEELVLLLYDGAIQALNRAVDEIEQGDLPGKRQSINRAIAIVQHLQSTLDVRHGSEIARGLDSLYNHVLSRILKGSTQLQVEPLREAAGLLTNLFASWELLTGKTGESPATMDEVWAALAVRPVPVEVGA